MIATVALGDTDAIAREYRAWLCSWSPSERTVKCRSVLAANRLRAWNGPDGFTSAAIQTWLGTYRGWSRATYYAHMNDFCRWLVSTGYLARNPMDDVRRPRKPRSVPRSLTDDEVDNVLAAASDRERVWILLALLAGLRVHEIAKLRGEDVTQTHIYVEGKGGVRAAIPTHPDIWRLAEDHPTVGYWFPKGTSHLAANSISQYVGALFRSLGMPGSIHRCRHTYGTRLLRAGVNIRVVQQLMRHSSLATTEVYLAVSEGELTDAISRLCVGGTAR